MSIESRSIQYGSIFGDWHIEKLLGTGSGGKSAVFSLYRDNEDWREYSAMKVVSLIEERGTEEALPEYRKTEYSTAAREQRISADREVRLMDQLRGKTNIVDYLDHRFFSWSDDSGFGVDLLIRMERLTDLRCRLQQGKLYSEEEIIQIGRDICQALIICHGKNILHRDIKPENIFFNADGDYKLGDFGIARIMDASSFHASTGIGTPQYWAPEQISGSYDARVDIYSLGLVLYELANRNRLPFATTSYVREQEIQKRMLGTPLPAPCAASEGLANLILKACAYRPEDRYQRAEDMLRDLDALPRAEESRQPFRSEFFQTVPAATGAYTQPASERTTRSCTGPDAYATVAANLQPSSVGVHSAANVRDTYATAAAAPEVPAVSGPKEAVQINGTRGHSSTGKKALRSWIILLAVLALLLVAAFALFLSSNAEDQNRAEPEQPSNIAETTVPPETTIPQTQPPTTEPPQIARVVVPVAGKTIAEYSMDALAYNITTRDWRVHSGIDIEADAGAVVRAAADGIVDRIYEDSHLGWTVVICHEDGYVTYYSSLADTVSVTSGETVKMGQQIGVVGNTALIEKKLGPHLHFGVTHNEEYINPAVFLSEYR